VPYRLTEAASRHVDEILDFSLRTYGRTAADRYDLLISAALIDIGADPMRPGSNAVPGVPGLRDYQIRHSRTRTPPGQRVANPYHKLVYRVADDAFVEILAVVGVSLPTPLGPKR
jgi:toxin ParE1/3/4